MSKLNRSLEGRTCVITGATSGVGRATAVALSKTGANLVLVARREEIGIRLAVQLRDQPGAGQVEFLRADVSKQRQVRALAVAITAKHERIDVLINNAGAKFDTFQQSADGIELTFATNYLGHFLLTALLLESLIRAKSARVITLGSGAHAGADARGPWCLGPENYDRKLAYCKSKLANIMFALELARRLSKTGVVSNSVDPGGVATNLGRNNGLLSWCRHLGFYALKRQLLTPRQGAETVVYLATDPGMQGVTGRYFHKKREVESSAASHDADAAEKLWSLSLDLTHLHEAHILALQLLVPSAALVP
jgi:retinol dehydrogenase 14